VSGLCRWCRHPPGIVAQDPGSAHAFTVQGGCPMPVTEFPPSAPTSAASDPLTTPVVLVEGTRTVAVLRGEADRSSGTSPVPSDALSWVTDSLAGDVVIDLAESDVIDTATVRILSRARHCLSDRGPKLTFAVESGRQAARHLRSRRSRRGPRRGPPVSVDRRQRRPYNPEQLRGVTWPSSARA
jgi:hypothetical protein